MAEQDGLITLLQRLADGKAIARDAGTHALSAESVRTLHDHGVVITDHALQIPGGLDVLHADTIVHELERRGQPARALEVVWSIDSTNSELLAHARNADIDRCVLLAEHQQAGRGRRGRTWMSPVACNLYISIGARFARIEDTQALSLCVGVALADALADSAGLQGIRIKWPNDLQIAGRKLSGILIESGGAMPSGAGQVCMVIGIGVNVRVPAYVGQQIDQPWIDLAQASSQQLERNRIAAGIIASVFALLESLRRGERAQWLQRFSKLDVSRDLEVTVRLPDREVHGIARGIDPSGELRVEVDGVLRVFSAGEVSLRLP